MQSKLVEMLHLDLEPVGIYFGNTEAECDVVAEPGKRNCVVPFLLSAARGKVAGIAEEGCTCPGGTVGLCFGEMKEGERFFCDEETALKWRNAMPFSDRGFPRVVFAPESRWEEVGEPDLVLVFADADRISALVTMLGFHNGRIVNTVVPYGAACHSIVFAAEQLGSDDPMAVMGLFDISQRSKAIANYLSLTMPRVLWEGLQEGLDRSCLTTHSWREIEKRL